MRQSMRITWILLLAVSGVFAAAPRLTGVSPYGGHTGDEITAHGEDLDSDSVAIVFLTDGRKDYRVSVKEQSGDSIQFTIPLRIKPGYYNLMLQTTGASPALLEQPISCQVLAEGEELIEEMAPELEIIEQETEEDSAAAKRKSKRKNKKPKSSLR